MTSTIGFATHGEVLKELYLAFGVLPRKEARAEKFNEKDKRTAILYAQSWSGRITRINCSKRITDSSAYGCGLPSLR